MWSQRLWDVPAGHARIALCKAKYRPAPRLACRQALLGAVLRWIGTCAVMEDWAWLALGWESTERLELLSQLRKDLLVRAARVASQHRQIQIRPLCLLASPGTRATGHEPPSWLGARGVLGKYKGTSLLCRGRAKGLCPFLVLGM